MDSSTSKHDETPSNDHNNIVSIAHGASRRNVSSKNNDKVPNREERFRGSRTNVQGTPASPGHNEGVDYAPVRTFITKGVREYKNFMSCNWAWEQADKIANENPRAHGCMFLPVILSCDMDPVTKDHADHLPLYMSTGIYHSTRQAPRGPLTLLAFLPVPKTDKEQANDREFRKFRLQVFRSSLVTVLEKLKPGMTNPEVARCSDGHFRRAIYGLGPYIVDCPQEAPPDEVI